MSTVKPRNNRLKEFSDSLLALADATGPIFWLGVGCRVAVTQMVEALRPVSGSIPGGVPGNFQVT
jgi:hypothetical protein